MLRQILPVSGLLLSTFFMLTASGLAFVIVPLRAQLEGWSPSTIGWLGAAYAAGFMAGCVYTPRMVLRVGHVRVFGVLAALLCISILIHSLFVSVPAWLAARGLSGFALAGAYMVLESWLNEQASNDNRGSLFSIYMMVNMSGLMAGQFLLVTGDPATTVLFIAAGVLYACAVIPTGLSNATSPQPLNETKLDIRKLFANSPVALTGALATGAVFGAWNFHAAIYGDGAGLSQAGIASMMAIAMVGGAIMQFPLGKLSDMTDRRLVLIGAGLASIAAASALVIVQPGAGPLLYAIMFVFGGSFMPIYSLVVAHGNDHADPSDFVEISSGLLIVYGIGSMAGPVVAGTMMDMIGRGGLFLTVAVVFAGFCAFTAYRLTRRDAIGEEDRIDFNYAPPLPSAITPETYTLDPRSDEAEYSSYEAEEEPEATSPAA